MPSTYVHLAGKAWTPGQPLKCWDNLVQDGTLTATDWNWPEAEIGQDGHVICLLNLADHSDRTTAEDLLEDEPWRTVVRVDLDADSEIYTTVVSEGYMAVYHRIPAECLTPMPSLRAALDQIAEEQEW